MSDIPTWLAATVAALTGAVAALLLLVSMLARRLRQLNRAVAFTIAAAQRDRDNLCLAMLAMCEMAERLKEHEAAKAVGDAVGEIRAGAAVH